MKLRDDLAQIQEWTLVGPLGPVLPDSLKSYPIMAVDGGAHFTQQGLVWVGDGDSFRNEEIKAEHIFNYPPEKSMSDLALALGLFRGHLPYKLHLWGFLGGRRDHELFNLGEASLFLENHPECQIIFYNSEGKIAFHFLGEGHWRFQHYGIFSVGTLKNTKVRITGDCVYPLKEETQISSLSSLGLSNEARGEVTLQSWGPVFVFYPEGK